MILYWCIKSSRYVWQDYIKTVNTVAGLETLEKFELGLEEVWERECSRDSDIDKVSLTNRSCHLAAFTKTFKLGLEEPRGTECSSDSDVTE